MGERVGGGGGGGVGCVWGGGGWGGGAQRVVGQVGPGVALSRPPARWLRSSPPALPPSRPPAPGSARPSRPPPRPPAAHHVRLAGLAVQHAVDQRVLQRGLAQLLHLRAPSVHGEAWALGLPAHASRAHACRRGGPSARHGAPGAVRRRARACARARVRRTGHGEKGTTHPTDNSYVPRARVRRAHACAPTGAPMRSPSWGCWVAANRAPADHRTTPGATPWHRPLASHLPIQQYACRPFWPLHALKPASRLPCLVLP